METLGFAMQVFSLALLVSIGLVMLAGYFRRRPPQRHALEVGGIALMALALGVYVVV